VLNIIALWRNIYHQPGYRGVVILIPLADKNDVNKKIVKSNKPKTGKRKMAKR
jgi:hypothetical protein